MHNNSQSCLHMKFGAFCPQALHGNLTCCLVTARTEAEHRAKSTNSWYTDDSLLTVHSHSLLCNKGLSDRLSVWIDTLMCYQVKLYLQEVWSLIG